MVFLVPARNGSKRIIDKNLCPVLGKPLIEYTFDSIETLKNSIPAYVSTDDERIKPLALARGLFVIDRPPELAADKTTMLDVLVHALDSMPAEDICVLYPTNPLRTSYHVLKAINLWEKPHPPQSTLMSVSPVDHRPYGLMEIGGNGFVKCLHSYGEFFYQSQKTPPLYRANGAIFIIPAKMIKERLINTQLFCKQTIPFVMDSIAGLEIDEYTDIVVIEAMMRYFGFRKADSPALVAVNA